MTIASGDYVALPIENGESQHPQTSETDTTNGNIFSDYFARCSAMFREHIMEPFKKWFKLSRSGRTIASIFQLWVIGDVLSDMNFMWKLIIHGNIWWVTSSIVILYLSLRFTLIFTITFEADFFNLKKTKWTICKILYEEWIFLREEGFRWEGNTINPSVQIIPLLFVPGAWMFAILLQKCRKSSSAGYVKAITRFLNELIGSTILYEFILIPILVVFVSPVVIVAHVVKGIKHIWSVEHVSFYENPLDGQTKIFYVTIASLFEIATESVPQFALQSCIYWYDIGFIPNNTYYIAAGFSLVNILKGLAVLILTWKEMRNTIYRLAEYIPPKEFPLLYKFDNDSTKLELKGVRPKTILRILHNYPNAKFVDLNEVEFTFDRWKTVATYMKQVNFLNLSKTDIKDNGLREVAENCKQLQTLNLTKTVITDDGLQLIVQSCNQLISLDLLGTNITDNGLTTIASSCKQIKELTLSGTKITDNGLKTICINCEQLISLDISSTKITDNGLLAIGSSCKQLNSLNISKIQTITNEGLSSIGSICNKLTSLILQGSNITEVGLNSIGSCLQLTSLTISSTHLRKGNTTVIWSNFSQVKSLDVSMCTLYDDDLKMIINNCIHLESINLSSTKITNEGLKSVGSSCKQWESLDLSQTKITDEGLAMIFTHCKQLKSLNLSFTAITDRGLELIASNCEQLNFLNLSWAKVTDKGLEIIRNSCKHLDSQNLVNQRY